MRPGFGIVWTPDGSSCLIAPDWVPSSALASHDQMDTCEFTDIVSLCNGIVRLAVFRTLSLSSADRRSAEQSLKSNPSPYALSSQSGHNSTKSLAGLLVCAFSVFSASSSSSLTLAAAFLILRVFLHRNLGVLPRVLDRSRSFLHPGSWLLDRVERSEGFAARSLPPSVAV